MIAPSNRLIALAAVVVVPLLTIAWISPETLPIVAAALLAVVFFAVADAVWGIRKLAEAAVQFPPSARFLKEKEDPLTFKMENAPSDLQIAADFPAEIEARRDGLRFLCLPAKRGDYALTQCFLAAASPAGLWSVRAIRPIQTRIRVYPNLRHDKTVATLLRRSLEGMNLQRQLGQGREFEKLRDYAPGDAFIDIHWKATARRGRPISKQYQIERTQEVYVVIDSSRLTARADALEHFVSAALAVSIAAGRQGDHFGLIAFSDKVEKFVRARSGMAHFLACRNAIYALQPSPVSPSFEELFSFIQTRLQRRALLLFLTALDDPLLAETFAAHCGVISRRHLVVVALPKENSAAPLFSGDTPADADEVYQRLAGHLAYRQLTELKKKIERQGLKFATLRPGHISADLASVYLSVKRSQAL